MHRQAFVLRIGRSPPLGIPRSRIVYHKPVVTDTRWPSGNIGDDRNPCFPPDTVSPELFVGA